jgi:hypothetical protein
MFRDDGGMEPAPSGRYIFFFKRAIAAAAGLAMSSSQQLKGKQDCDRKKRSAAV